MHAIFLTVLLGASTSASGAVDTARVFLDTLAKDPQSTRSLVTDDALFVAGDIGGPYSELLKEPAVGEDIFAAFFTHCSRQSIEQKPTPPTTELRNYPAPSFRSKGTFAVVVAHFGCRRDDGSAGTTDTAIYLKDGRVVMFGLSIPRR